MTDDRTTYIGGPGMASILGVNPWQSALGYWQCLTKRAPPVEVNKDMRSGRLLEQAVLAYAGEELGEAILPGPFVRDVALPIAGGHLDGLTESTGNVVEGKTARSRKGYGDPGTDQVPPHVVVQDLWYLGLVPQAQICWTPVLFSGLDFALYQVPRNDQVIEQMRNIAWRWWQDHIVGDMPPPPQTGADCALLFPKDTGKVVVASDAVAEAVARLRDIRAECLLLESEEEHLESSVKLAMGDAASLALADGEIAATWKTTKPAQRLDSAALKAAEPETYERYCREISSRRFLLK